MATSGVTTFTVTRDDIIKAAMRVLGVIGIGETPGTEDLTNASQALNILIKAVQTEGVPLWTYKEIVLPLVANKSVYTIGTTGDLVTPRPLRIIDGFIRVIATGADTTLQQISREEYDQYGMKTTGGVPNSFYYDPQLTNGIVSLYNVPTDATREIHFHIQRPLEDMVSGTDNFDCPQEWFQVFKYGLASELGVEYGVSQSKQALVEQKYQFYLEKMMSWSQEEASTFFSPSPQFR